MKTLLMRSIMCLSLSAIALEATPIDLIVNGEFETPVLSPGDSWEPYSIVPGWVSTETHIELWIAGFLGSPALGTDGLGTGQHMEINWNTSSVSISQTVTIPVDVLPTVELSFDAWARGASATGYYSVTGSISGPIVSGVTLTLSTGSWTKHTIDLLVQAGEDLTVVFGTLGAPNTTAITPHIDQVSLLVTPISSPEPATMLLCAGGMIVFGLAGRRRIKKYIPHKLQSIAPLLLLLQCLHDVPSTIPYRAD